MNKSIILILLSAIVFVACSSEPANNTLRFTTGKPDLLSAIESSDLFVVVTVVGVDREFPGELQTDGRWNVNLDVAFDTQYMFFARWFASGNSQRVLLVEQSGEFFASSANTTIQPGVSSVSSGDIRFDADCDNITNLAELDAGDDPLSSPGCESVAPDTVPDDGISTGLDIPDTSIDESDRPLAGFVQLNGGCFLMGSADTLLFHNTNERQHEVCVDPFSIGRYEVTFEEYSEFSQTFGRSAQPVTEITFNEAVS